MTGRCREGYVGDEDEEMETGGSQYGRKGFHYYGSRLSESRRAKVLVSK
jgi:hypothetical protein